MMPSHSSSIFLMTSRCAMYGSDRPITWRLPCSSIFPQGKGGSRAQWEDRCGPRRFVWSSVPYSLHTLEESGEAIRQRQMGSELDLNNFARFTVEDPVSQIIERLSKDSVLLDRLGLKGFVTSENHSNALSPSRTAEEMYFLRIPDDPSSVLLSVCSKRRSRRLIDCT